MLWLVNPIDHDRPYSCQTAQLCPSSFLACDWQLVEIAHHHKSVQIPHHQSLLLVRNEHQRQCLQCIIWIMLGWRSVWKKKISSVFIRGYSIRQLTSPPGVTEASTVLFISIPVSIEATNPEWKSTLPKAVIPKREILTTKIKYFLLYRIKHFLCDYYLACELQSSMGNILSMKVMWWTIRSATLSMYFSRPITKFDSYS